MAKYNFNLRDRRSLHSTPINLVIRWSGHRVVYSTGEAIPPKHWHDVTQRAKQTRSFPEHPELNERLESLLKIAKATFRTFQTEHEREPALEELRTALDLATGRTEPRHRDLLAFLVEHVERKREGVNDQGKRLHPHIYKMNLITLRRLREYVKATNQGSRVPMRTLEPVFADGFAKFLTKKGLSTNTVGRYLRTFRAFVNAAAKQGHEVNPAVLQRGVIPTPKEDTDKIYLSQQELMDMYGMDLTIRPRLERVRDLFLIGAWTGLRFGDLTSLTLSHVEGDRIRIRPRKTGKAVVIPVHPVMRAILEKYGGSLPTAISNQKMNNYIKEVAALVPSLQQTITVGITKGGVRRELGTPKHQLVSSHTARRSFASNAYLDGIPVPSIMAITGHRTESAFLRYLRLDGEQHADIVAASTMFSRPMLKVI